MFIQLLAIAFVVVTIPVWGGAMVALFTFGIHLMITAPWLLLLIFAAPFVLRMLG